MARSLGVSERRLLGWVPSVRHEHFDAADNLTGTTVVTAESEWDDRELAKMLALGDYEAGVCDCGIHSSQTDPEHHRYAISERTCPVCASLSIFGRVQSDRDEHAVKQMKAGAESLPVDVKVPSDGRKTMLGRQPDK